MKRTPVRWYSPEDARNTANLASLGYVYSINSPTSRPTMFATHVDLRSVVPFHFGADDWLRLSPSDPYHRYLAVNPDGSEMSFPAVG
jgi:hypothetical protein